MEQMALLFDKIDVAMKFDPAQYENLNKTVFRQVETRAKLRQTAEEMVNSAKKAGVDIDVEDVIAYCEELSKTFGSAIS